MRKILTMLAFSFCISLVSQAQAKTGKVSGAIKDGGQKTMESATIMLLNASDSSVVKLTIADKEGKYQFEGIKEGRYLISVSAVGHAKEFSEVFTVLPESVFSVKTIELVPQAKALEGVTVTSKKPFIEQKADRMVVNVEASVTNVGANALEVLEKSPGISVDNDGNISLKGKQGVVIYIDGRPSYLSGADLATLLKNMNASQLEQIEIMTNPPAKYDAAGNSGVINIKIKKNKQVGYNGTLSLNYTQGRYPKINEGANMNYRKNKVNIFTNLNHSYRDNFQNLDIQRTFRDKDSKQLLSFFDQEARMRMAGRSYNAKLGADFYLTNKTTLGFVVSGFENPGSFRNRNITNISDANGNLINQTRAKTDVTENWRNFSTNVNLRQLLDTSGKELTADFDYIHYRSSNNQTLVNSYFDNAGNPIQPADTLLGGLPQDIAIYSIKADYIHPLKNGATFEAGVKSSYVKTDNDARYDSLINGRIIPDLIRSNHFIYEENINAAYVNLNKQLSKKWSAQLGLRLENTNAKGDQATTGQTFTRNYTQLFPTAYFTYTASEKNQFNFNYGRRINRPNYADLNPFIFFIDRYTFQQGNPNLKPQFSHNIELRHTYNGFLVTTFNYTRTTDIIQEVLEQNEQRNETFVKKSNIATQRQIGLSVNAFKQLTRWWTGNIWMNGYNNKFSGTINDTTVTLDANTLEMNISNQFKFKKGWSGEIGGFYRSAGLDDVFLLKSFGTVNMGISKQVLKDKGTIRLNVRDMFFTQKIKGSVKYSNLDVQFQNLRDSRTVSIGFTYRFAKGKVNGNKRRTGGATDEQNRVSVGNN